jgi:hypothetical protein
MLTAKLIVNQPGQRSRSVEIAGAAVSIGRRLDNTVCLNDSNISKYHAVIERRDGAYWVVDLGSSNGTTVNGQPVTGERALQDNDIICLGGTSTLQIHLGAGAQQAAQQGASASAFAMPSVGVPSMPTYSTPSVPSVPSVQAPQYSLPQPQTPQPPAAAQRIMGMPQSVVAGLGGAVVVGGLVAILWATGVIGGGSSVKTPRAKNEPTREQSASQASDDTTTSGSKESSTDTTSSTTSTTTATQDTASSTGGDTTPTSGGANADVTAALSRTLAVQISQKSSYNFDPHFVALINSYVNEYRGATGYYDRAGKYREAIDREFVNVQGIQPPLIAYVLAMSQTKFVDKGGAGVWNIPPQVARSYSNGADANPSDPAASTKIAAAYMRSLLDLFERDNFMYAIACYGMTLDDAGKVRVALESKDPTGQQRTDFWKMKNAGVVSGPQVERVARFFAAGIVCENPTQFGLKEKPLSSLY